MTSWPIATPRDRPATCGLPSPHGSGPYGRSRTAPRQDQDRVLQGREPAGEGGAHQLRLPRLYLPGPHGSWSERLVRELLTSHEHQGGEGERPADQGLAPQSSHRDTPVRSRRGHQPSGPRLDQLLRGPSTAPSCIPSHGASTSTSSDGPCRSSSDSEANPPGHGTGWPMYASEPPSCSPTGCLPEPPPVGSWEPYDARVSRTVLREREDPSRHSPDVAGAGNGVGTATEYGSPRGNQGT